MMHTQENNRGGRFKHRRIDGFDAFKDVAQPLQMGQYCCCLYSSNPALLLTFPVVVCQ